MIFRPLELAVGEQTGFSLFSFSWEEGGFNSLLGIIWDSRVNTLYISILLKLWVFNMEVEDE